jgi:radical SAM superfamily enzyme YgiQ (UPF0313 family)
LDPLRELEAILSTFEPDLVGIRSLSIARETFCACAIKVRKMHPDLPIIAGGPYPSASYQEVLTSEWADLVVIGEGELSFVELIAYLRNKGKLPETLDGTAVLKNGKPLLNNARAPIQVLDTLPFPDYQYLDLEAYRGIKNHCLGDSSRTAFITASRGCPFRCFYCHQLFGSRLRRRSPANIIAEMREHIDSRGITEFVFTDDLFNVPLAEAKQVLRAIINDLPPVHLNFPNGMRADQLDLEFLDLLERAGTVEVALAVESAVPRLQIMMGKNLNVEKAVPFIHEASKRFITRLFFIIGFPTETVEEAQSTIDLAASFVYAAQPMLSILRVYGSTELLNYLKPTKEQMAALAKQEEKTFHLEMFHDAVFYGDLFPPEKVPLRSDDIRELMFSWMRDVLVNPDRLAKSHEVISRHLNPERQLDFYRSVFNKPEFSEHDLKKLIATSA